MILIQLLLMLIICLSLSKNKHLTYLWLLNIPDFLDRTKFQKEKFRANKRFFPFFFSLWNSSFNPWTHFNHLKNVASPYCQNSGMKSWINSLEFCKQENVNVLQHKKLTSETRLTVLPTMIPVDWICWRPSKTRSTCSDNATSIEFD